MTWKVPVFDMFYVISQLFLKISTWNFLHIFISHCPLTYGTVFENFDFEEEYFEKEKEMLIFFESLENFQSFENPR